MKFPLLAAALALLMAVPAAPASDDVPARTVSTGTVDLMQGLTPAPVSLDTPVPEGASAALTDFSLRLLRHASSGDSTLLSPLSVLCALGMTAGGARGETLVQLEAAFGLEEPALRRLLHDYAASLPDALRLANAIWFKDTALFTPAPAFLQQNADWYGAGLYLAPFDQTTLAELNDWVSCQTNGRIPSILDQFHRDAVMVLVNALAFEGTWECAYEPHQMTEAPFFAADGTEQPATFLHSRENLYLEDEMATGVLKPYEGGRFAFAALLPGEEVALDDYVASLTGDRLYTLISTAQRTPVDTAIPRFETETTLELNGALRAMGITDAFDGERADFSALGSCLDGANLAISRVVHKTWLKLDEKGTEAAAATAVEMIRVTSLRPEEPKTVRLDRPFLYLIVDLENGLPVFLGTLNGLEG